jgi:hypothetical protein
MSANCPCCDAVMEDLGLELWYCRYCEEYWRPDHRTGVMDKVILRSEYDRKDLF